MYEKSKKISVCSIGTGNGDGAFAGRTNINEGFC